MTIHLYFNDSTLTTFEAIVVHSIQSERGFEICLDQTAFYPTSGGQPHDSGTINGNQVLDVWEDDKGQIWHLLKKSPKKPMVLGLVNWLRRFDHMQQHTGQHLLSAVFLEKFNANTIGFHIGSKVSTIDFDLPNLSEDEITIIEEKTNRIIWENHPIKIHFITEDEINKYPFRKIPQVSGEIRVIQIEDIDLSACGGTHVNRTGEIGIIKIAGKERYKGGIRISYLCGHRALRDYQKVTRVLGKVSASLSIRPEDLTRTIAKMQEETSEYRQAYNNIHNEFLHLEAERIWHKTEEVDGMKRIYAYWDNRPGKDLQEIANRLRKFNGALILLASTDDGKVRLLCTRSDDLSNFHANELLKETTQILGGRGGGSSEMAQGGAPATDHEKILKTLRKVIQNL